MEENIQALHNDNNILERLRNDDRQALELLFKTHYAPLCRFAKNILKDKDQAEDMVQEVFLKIWDKRNELKVSSSLKAYLFMAVKNHCLNTLKLNERKNWLDEDMENDTLLSNNEVESKLNAKQLNEKIQQAIELLPEKCKLTFQLSRHEEMSYKEIAELMNVSVKTVENQMCKALSFLRKNILPYLSIYLFLT